MEMWKKTVLGRVPRSKGKGKRLMSVSISKTRVLPEPLLVEAPSDENPDHLGMVEQYLKDVTMTRVALEVVV